MENNLPFKAKILAKLLGLDMKFLSGLWNWLDGKKTYFGLFLSALAVLAEFWPQVAAAFPNAKWVLVGAGVIQFLNGWAHKAYKYRYKEEHP
jgi:hypothetical protein